MNRYLRKGLAELLIGTLLVLLGYYLMAQESSWYKPAMTLGVIIFSIGVLTIMYRMIRKVDRTALLNYRKKNKKSDRRNAE